jgi:cytochrome c553
MQPLTRTALLKWLVIAVAMLTPGSAMVQQPPATAEPPKWAFLPLDDRTPPRWDATKIKRVPGSPKTYNEAAIHSGYDEPDWFPEDHPPAPHIVQFGRNPVRACAFCHGITGLARPESAALAGLTANYILAQIEAFKTGTRPVMPPRSPSGMQPPFFQSLSAEDARAAAEYFASLKPQKRVRVEETDTVPKMIVKLGHMLLRTKDGGSEPIGNRVVELPEDEERFEDHDPRAGSVAYVPRGSIRKGEELVKTGSSGKTIPCGICHGADHKGMGDVPWLAGRSPLYMARQLFNFQAGARRGEAADLMKPVVAGLGEEDIVAITAYLATLDPR